MLTLAACGRPGVDLAAIEPDVVSTQVETPALIRGSGLLGTVAVDLDDDSEPVVDAAWRVEIGAVEVDAAPDGAGNLALTLPAGLPLGTHDLVVTGPGGATATLPGALTVIDGDPDADAGADASSVSCDICAGGTCQGGCVIDCSTAPCEDRIVCPPGADCTVDCGGTGACAGGVDCSLADSCTIDCSGGSSCQGSILCGPGRCDLHCSGNDSCPALDCGAACACEITCSGSTTCQPPATCPNGCEQGRGCTDEGAGCDTCP